MNHICIVDGCTRTSKTQMCPMHRSRKKRTGTYDARPPKTFTPTMATNGYLRITVVKQHPLVVDGQRSMWMHRVVLFDTIGYGPHRCYECGTHVNWGNGLIVDHLDENKTNNHPTNLEPACNGCNVKRGWAHSPHRGTGNRTFSRR